MNIHTLVGRLGRDPETKHTQSGTEVCLFTVATDRMSGGEKVTDWHSCVAFGKTAQFVAGYFSKGRVIGLSGSVQTRSWENEDGTKRYKTETVVDRAWFIPRDSGGDEGERERPAAKPAPKQQPKPAAPNDDDIPF